MFHYCWFSLILQGFLRVGVKGLKGKNNHHLSKTTVEVETQHCDLNSSRHGLN